MSVAAMAWAYAQQDTKGAEKFVLVTLADAADDDGVCWPGRRFIAERTGISPAQVSRHLAKLEAKGLLRREERVREDGSRASNLYVLPLTPPTQKCEGGVRKCEGALRENAKGPYAKMRRHEPKEEPSKDEKTFPPEVHRLCELMARLQNERVGRDEFKVKRSWLVDMDRLIRLDGRSPQAVERCLHWIHRHEFWHANVLSPGKLRKQWAKLELQARRDAGKRKPPARSREADAARAAELEAMRGDDG